MTDIAALVLAGGKSSRMGRDKALINFRGQPLLTQICTIAQECASQVYVITPRLEKYRQLVPQECQLIAEELPNKGPLVAFARALPQIKETWILLLACDLPCLQASVIKQWQQYLDSTPTEAIALLPRHEKGWESLCGFYRRSCLPSLTDYINSGGSSFQQWLKQNSVRELPVSDRRILFNCNTPKDLEQLNTFNLYPL